MTIITPANWKTTINDARASMQQFRSISLRMRDEDKASPHNDQIARVGYACDRVIDALEDLVSVNKAK